MLRRARLAPAPSVLVAAALLAASPALAFDSFVPDPNDRSHYPSHANGQQNERPFVHAQRVDAGAIEVDGRLDEGIWASMPTGWGFVEMEPNRGEPAGESTVFRVAYDDEAIYFAVACFEKDPSRTSSALCRRDNLENSDLVSVYLDPYHDRTTGYNFRVNPDGALLDAYIFDDGNRDDDWNAVWQAETYRDERGWTTEMRIPFAAMRYRAQEEMTWGLQVYRWMHGRGEDHGWANWERNAAGFVSRFGELRGLRDVPAARQLEVTPYVVARSTNPDAGFLGDGDGDLSDFQNFGADLKYGLTADLTLNATFQPDFGQVEADPAVLNLGPFETFFEEKRPFFVDGARAFEHSNFTLFYSRRIGAGDENSRIRFASKLIGKVAGDVSVAGLVATTDQTVSGRTHNPLVSGTNQTWYAVGRVGKEFSKGAHRVNLMGTAVMRDEALRTDLDASSVLSRDAYSSGADFELTFREREVRVSGSLVATIVDDAAVADGTPVDHDPVVGTGGSLSLGKYGGLWRGSVSGRWEGDKLDPNDMGLLFAPDEYSTSAWVQRRLGGPDSFVTNGNVNFNFFRSWLFAGRAVADPNDPTRDLFAYAAGRPQAAGGNVNSWFETRNRWNFWSGVWHDLSGISKYETRFFDGERGPLVATPSATGGWAGFGTDYRKTLHFQAEVNLSGNVEGNSRTTLWSQLRWVQNERMNHRLSASWSSSTDDAQWIGNFATATDQPGIGDVSYVFGELESETVDVTLRSNVLFTRNQSLELYAQPFLARGRYSNPRALTRPASYDLAPIDTVVEDDAEVAYDVSREDFRFASVNLNAVYRWEFSPGSTLFLVWTHARDGSLIRGADPTERQQFDRAFDRDALFRNRPTNVFLAKVSWWFSM